MATVDANWVVPSANPINAPPGVSSVVAGSGITITGTTQNPIIAASVGTGAVTAVEGLVGSIDIVGGSGLTVTSGSQEITLTPNVAALIAGTNCSITEYPAGSKIYTINNTGALTAGVMTSDTQQFNAPDGTSVVGGGTPLNLSPISIVAGIDPAKNSSIFLELTMCGIGTKLQQPTTSNQISCGIYITRPGGGVDIVVAYVGPLQVNIDVNWGTTIPSLSNQGVIPNLLRAAIPYADYISGNVFFGYFASYQLLGTPYYGFNSLKYNLNTIYMA